MYRVKLLGGPDGGVGPVKRQSFQGAGLVRNYHFDESHVDYDILLSIGGGAHVSNEIAVSSVPKDRRFVLQMENPLFYRLSDVHVDLFKFVISAVVIPLPEGTELIQTHPSPPWFYDIDFDTTIGLSHSIINYDRNKNLEFYCEEIPMKKDKLLSMITSTKGMSEGHKLRVSIATQLKQVLKNEIDLYGFGHSPIANKRDAIDDYKYSIVVENCISEYYITEKIFDVILGGATPIYIGASRINEFYKSHIYTVDPQGKNIEMISNEILLYLEREQSESIRSAQRFETLFNLNFFYHMANIFDTHL